MNDFLSQEEIDALLRGEGEVEDGDAREAGADRAATGPAQPESPQERQPTDTTSQEGTGTRNHGGNDTGTEELPDLDEMERDTLAEVGNISMGAAATALSTLVNRKVSITVPSVSVTTMAAVQERYPIPCIVVKVQYIQGLTGHNLLIIKERDAAVIASLMMGEDGSDPPEELTELHLSAVSEAMNQMMGSAATSMSNMFNEFIEISPPEIEDMNLAVQNEAELAVGDPLVQVSFRIEIEDLIDSEMVQLVELDFARRMVQRLLNPGAGDVAEEASGESPIAATEAAAAAWTEEELSGEEESEGAESATGRRFSPATANEPQSLPGGDLGNLNIELIKNIPVKIRAILGRSRLPIETVLRLGPGSIVELDTLDGEPIEVLANDTLIARGEVVVVGEQFGVRITEIAAPMARIHSVG